MEPGIGLEPMTDGLQNRCSTTELTWQKSLTKDYKNINLLFIKLSRASF